MYHHSVTSLNNLFNTYDLQLFDVERVNIQKGSIIGYVCKKNTRQISSRVKRCLKREHSNGDTSYKKLINFSNFIKIQKKNALKILNNYKINEVGAYGSARSGPTYAFNFGLFKKFGHFFDDHPLKVNKFSFFNGYKVLATKKIDVLRPKILIILAYLHSKKIIRKNLKIEKRWKVFNSYPKISLVNKRNYKIYLMKIKIGFISAGFISQIAHLPSFYDDKGKSFALSELNKDLDKVSKKYQIKKIKKSYKDMIDNEKLDGLVLVANRSNVEKIACDILMRGIPLFSEKPMATSYLFAKKLVSLSKKNKTKYLVGHMKRHDNGIKVLKKILHKKKLGKLLSVYYQNFIGDSFYNPFDYFRHDKNYRKKNNLNKNLKNKKLIFLRYLNSNGHCINLIRFLFGDIKVLSKNLSHSGRVLYYLKIVKMLI